MVDKITDLFEIQFPKLGWTFHINPTAFKIGSLEVQWYGLIITIGMILALVYCFPRMKRFGLDPDRAVDAVIGGVLGGIVGARIYYVAFNWGEYKDNLKSVFNTREGGLAIYGGLIGALAVGLLICKIRKVKALPMLDIACLGFLIGQGIGRWGNFVNQEAFGGRTDSFLGMTGGRIQEYIFENSASLGGKLVGDSAGSGIANLELYPVHPCFLYESIWCLLGFALLAFWSKHRKYDGQILLMYMAWYGAERFVVEGLRSDSLYIGSIRVSQALSAVIFIVSVILQIVMFSKVRRDPEKYVLYASTKESRMLIEEGRRRRMGMSHEDAKTTLDDDDDFDPTFDDEEDYDEDGEVSSILGNDDDDEDADDNGDPSDEKDDEDDGDPSDEKNDEDDGDPSDEKNDGDDKPDNKNSGKGNKKDKNKNKKPDGGDDDDDAIALMNAVTATMI